MKINIKGCQVRLQKETINKLKRRLRFSLSRFGHVINGITVRLTDINGPKGGRDKDCLLVVKLRQGGEIVVRGNGVDCVAALYHCADRSSHTVGRELSRRRMTPIRKMRRIQSSENSGALDLDEP